MFPLFVATTVGDVCPFVYTVDFTFKESCIRKNSKFQSSSTQKQITHVQNWNDWIMLNINFSIKLVIILLEIAWRNDLCNIAGLVRKEQNWSYFAASSIPISTRYHPALEWSTLPS